MNKGIKFVLWLIGCVVIGFIFAVFLHDICRLGDISALISLVFSALLFLYIYVKKLNIPDSRYYGQAEQEVDDGMIDQGLWAKALVNTKGNEEIRKVEYIMCTELVFG